jgi:hypothetical protein
MQAFTAVRRVSEALGLQAGRIARVEFQLNREAISIIDLEGLHIAELRGEGVVALLVAYCSRIEVPLPRTAKKSVEITSRSVVLRIETERRRSACPRHSTGHRRSLGRSTPQSMGQSAGRSAGSTIIGMRLCCHTRDRSPPRLAGTGVAGTYHGFRHDATLGCQHGPEPEALEPAREARASGPPIGPAG